ncbi:MAG: hypothetical protein AMXMBFR23_17230 [Chloroflexota bacterium]
MRVPRRLRLPIGTNLGQRWRFRGRPLADHPRTSYQTRVFGTPAQRWFFLDGLTANASDTVVVQFLSIYAIALGATNTEVGMIAIANGLAGAIALYPGARIAERVVSRKRVVLLGAAGVGRLAVLAMALTPLLLREPRHAVYGLIALTFLRWLGGSLSHPSWVSLLADIIPLDLRRFYVSQRMLGMTVVGAFAAPAAGFGIRAIGGVEGFQWVFAAAFAFGIASTFCYSRIPEPPRPRAEDRPKGSLREMLADGPFTRYLAATFMLHTTTMIVGPFFAAYLVRDLGATTAEVGVLATVDLAAAVTAQLALGFVVARYPTEHLVRIVMFTSPFIPFLWLFATEPWHAALPHLVGGASWAVYNVVSFNLLMEYAPTRNIPRYAAVHQMTVLVASFLGPTIGTLIVAGWGIRAAMVISSAGRFVAAGMMFLPVRRPPAA